jgi:NTE family protein
MIIPPISPKSALVLGGGSLKGAFQTGAVLALFEHGFVPDALYGISVGGLNATFLAHEAARQQAETGSIDWPKAGHALIEFWIRNITKPDDVAQLRPPWRLGLDTLMSRFDGFVDNAPLKTLLRKSFDTERLRTGPIPVKVGAVDVTTGEMVYADATDPNFIDYLFASSAVPVLMPGVQIGGDHRRTFMDGGLREVAPVRLAIDDGATNIACIACHAEQIANTKFNYRNLLNLMDRVKDITVNQLVNNDLVWAKHFAYREQQRGSDFRFRLIRPTEPIELDLLKFTAEDIGKMIVKGYETGFLALQSAK